MKEEEVTEYLKGKMNYSQIVEPPSCSNCYYCFNHDQPTCSANLGHYFLVEPDGVCDNYRDDQDL